MSGALERIETIVTAEEFKGLGATELRVLMVLLYHGFSDGYSWPSVARLVDMTGTSRRTVQRTLGGLESKGLVLRGPNCGRRTRAYQVAPGAPCGDALTGAKAPRGDAPTNPGAPNRTTNGRKAPATIYQIREET